MIYDDGDFRKFRADELLFAGAYSPLVEGTKTVEVCGAVTDMLIDAIQGFGLGVDVDLEPPAVEGGSGNIIIGPCPLHEVKSAAAMIQKRVDELAVDTRDPAEALVAESAWEACTANSQAAPPRVWVYALGFYTPRSR